MISPTLRRLLLLRTDGRGVVAAPADVVTEPVGGGGTVEGDIVASDEGEDSFVGVRSFFSIVLFELCLRWDLIPFAALFRSEERLFPGRRPAEMSRSDTTRRIATVCVRLTKRIWSTGRDSDQQVIFYWTVDSSRQRPVNKYSGIDK